MAFFLFRSLQMRFKPGVLCLSAVMLAACGYSAVPTAASNIDSLKTTEYAGIIHSIRDVGHDNIGTISFVVLQKSPNGKFSGGFEAPNSLNGVVTNKGKVTFTGRIIDTNVNVKVDGVCFLSASGNHITGKLTLDGSAPGFTFNKEPFTVDFVAAP
jgi:hypothetical protein